MLYVIAFYWPFIVAALALGIAVGWWYQDPRSSSDDADAWLEPEGEER